MSFKTLYISNPCKIYVKDTNIAIKQENEVHSVHAKDVSIIVLETNQATISTPALELFSKNNILLITIDKYFLPSTITIPFYAHSLHSKIVHKQVELTKAFKKRVWQKIVESKIKNQSLVLEKFLVEDVAIKLNVLAKNTLSGDSTNQEAKAARIYWSALFDDFVRIGDGALDIRNSALNYAYAIVRSCVSRSVVGVGLSPVFGFFHKNYFNSFNLVDDLIEPFRPFVDMIVKELLDEFEEDYLTKELKASLINILNLEIVDINGGLSSLKTAIHMFVSSVQKSILEDDLKCLVLPKVAEEILEYECI